MFSSFDKSTFCTKHRLVIHAIHQKGGAPKSPPPITAEIYIEVKSSRLCRQFCALNGNNSEYPANNGLISQDQHEHQ